MPNHAKKRIKKEKRRKIWFGAIPAKLNPGTPSISAGQRMPCQWIEVGTGKRLVTARVTVSPSRHRKIGPGADPLTVVATTRRPVKLTGNESPQIHRRHRCRRRSRSIWSTNIQREPWHRAGRVDGRSLRPGYLRPGYPRLIVFLCQLAARLFPDIHPVLSSRHLSF